VRHNKQVGSCVLLSVYNINIY